ncbi:alpha/beta hydrolase [Kitasatospora sp. MMS16-BH015]|uniref:DUF4180 domain-containing protein n=1 Tax=Kitasatospora sp. MMS16-BH015 TaxID=2018025 RepID=UPI000CA2685D|nr:DUF4180 domain-containing protein [Kitasatospora sp. MMS16-BH015]AUG81362.1 alpha/beta hydrolase [Kitasatospora sp. MMS16-BH015]
MPDHLRHLADTPVLACAPDGPPIADERAATDLLGDAMGLGAEWVALPVERLPPEFFQLRTGLAGTVVQKFATYRLGLAVLGEIQSYLDTSTALRDFVFESNRGRQLWFLPDAEALHTRLTTH